MTTPKTFTDAQLARLRAHADANPVFAEDPTIAGWLAPCLRCAIEARGHAADALTGRERRGPGSGRGGVVMKDALKAAALSYVICQVLSLAVCGLLYLAGFIPLPAAVAVCIGCPIGCAIGNFIGTLAAEVWP